jgi:hypothetical protein
MSFKQVVDKSVLQVTPFASYQDMIDGQYIMEHSDNDSYDSRVSQKLKYPQASNAADDDSYDSRESQKEKFVIYDDEYEPDEFSDSLSEITAPEINTISLMNDLFNYCKKISRSHKKLKQKVNQMNQTIMELNARLNQMETVHARRFSHIITESVDL